MNYIRLLKQVQKLLLNSLLAVSIIFLSSCGNDKNDKVPENKNEATVNYDSLLNAARANLSEYKSELIPGKYDQEEGPQLAGLYEVEKKGEWGIKFVQFKEIGGKINKSFESKLYEGSLKDSEIKKIVIDSSENDLIYYNSGDFFAGNRIGDVYAYVVDYRNKKISYAHLFYGYSERVSLFISPETDAKIKDFLLNEMKKNYQVITIVKKDNIE